MNRFPGRRLAFALACVALAAGCAGGSSSSSPLTSPTGPSPLSSLRPSDIYDGLPDPAPVDPTVPAPAPPVPELPVHAPPPLTIDIVGAVGPAAFAPNPLEGTIGAMLAWKNSDLLPHHIVLGDGTVVGNVAPGQTTVGEPMTTASGGTSVTRMRRKSWAHWPMKPSPNSSRSG